MGKYLKVAGLTDVGIERDHNEDSFGLFSEFNLFVVADGMGGHRAGDVASKMAVDTIEQFFKDTESDDVTWPFQFDPKLSFSVNRFSTAIQLANNKIFSDSVIPGEHTGMGTTVVGILSIDDNSAMHIAHVGDSRCYRLRDGDIELMTEDHSLINDYLRAAPDLSPEQLAELPTNVITRALGMQEMVEVDMQTAPVEVGDIMLLCSDGLSGMLTDEQIGSIVNEHINDLPQACAALVDAANQHGGEDNSTVVLVQVCEG
ncbi:MAG: Stp1/IreP family PP2C-type Ser/Thr phosphatase [Myxococcales bacterium]|nr:Stp1/IreP family PP2C-type Ser/Thr phosphatase [Myxococcales bacterium]